MTKESKYFLIDRPEPTEHFMESRRVLYTRMQEHFSFEFGEPPEIHAGYRIIKADIVFPSFDHFSFGYKNTLFSVLIDLVDEKNNSLTSKAMIENLVEVAKNNNLVPCLFKIRLNTMEPLMEGWNLLDAVTNELVIPEEIAKDKQVKLSEWEYNNLAINMVVNSLNNKALFYCDTPGISPQIWFEDQEGKECWILVKYAVASGSLKTPKDYIVPQELKRYDGYFAKVVLSNADPTNQDKPIYRTQPVSFEYHGLEKIWDKE